MIQKYTMFLDNRRNRSGVTVCAMGGESSVPVLNTTLTITLQPFNNEYHWFNTSANYIVPNTTISKLNTYIGGAEQQATSTVTETGECLCNSSDQLLKVIQTRTVTRLAGLVVSQCMVLNTSLVGVYTKHVP